MAARPRAYVCFDADTDMKYYTMMKAWKANDHMDFDFDNAHDLNTLRDGSSEETIKAKLLARLKASKMLIVLIGDKTKNLYKFVRWEIEKAIELGLPIICVNLNGKKQNDTNLNPPILDDKLRICIPYGQKIMQHAIDKWPGDHQNYTSQGKTSAYYYVDSVYANLERQV